MDKTGIVSVTFRPLPPSRIVELAAQAGLDGVEWGSDVHVPPTDSANAENVAAVTAGGGLSTLSYGSYFRAGYSEDALFDAEVRTAKILGAPNIRIWAGSKGSETEENRTAVADSIRVCAQKCRSAGMTLSLEFHQNTLTDHYESALRLIDEVAHENLHLYWQPDQFRDTAYNLSALRAVLRHVSNVHVFTWEGKEKFPLIHGETLWRQYIDILRGDGKEHGYFLEFVCDGTEKQFREDAAVLKQWISG